MKTVYILMFIVAMAFVGRAEAGEARQAIPGTTKIYIQGGGDSNRYMLYRYSTVNCDHAYGVIDTATGKELVLPQTSFSCTFRFGPRLINSGEGLTVVLKLDADSYYVKNVESI